MYTFYLKEVCIIPKSLVLLSFHLFCICRYFILTCCFCVIISKNRGQSLPVAQWNINPALILENIWYHEESTVYNIINLCRHEQILLIMLRFKRYLSWHVTSLNICSWRDQVFILGKLKRQLWFLPKEQVFFHRRQFYSFILLKGKTNYTLLFFILHFVSGVLLFIETKD